MNHVAFFRKCNGITQEDLAKCCGISRMALSLIENGADCRVSTAIKICNVLDKTLTEVFPNVEITNTQSGV